jgi:hypothetical protein
MFRERDERFGSVASTRLTRINRIGRRTIICMLLIAALEHSHKLVFPHGELGYDRSLEGSITQAVERFFVGLAAIGFAALVVCLIWLLLFWLDWLDWFYEVTAG